MSAVFDPSMALLKKRGSLTQLQSGPWQHIRSIKIPPGFARTRYVDADQPQDWEAAIQPNTKMIYVETLTNPGLDIIDLEAAGKKTQPS
jgi:O-succinylhomoserine sulfhydrylase